MLKQLIVGIFFFKTTIIYLKFLYLILNIQVLIQSFYFELLNMYKFKKPIYIMFILVKKKVYYLAHVIPHLY